MIMSVTPPEVEDRSWVVPYCEGCPPPPAVSQKPTYEDVKRTRDAGCEKCRLFVQGIDDFFSPEARSGTVEWSWIHSVLTGRRRGQGRSREEEADREEDNNNDGDDGDNPEMFYEVEFSIYAGTRQRVSRLAWHFHRFQLLSNDRQLAYI
jgi:hypothetical protein